MFAERRKGEGSLVGGDAVKAVNGVVVKRRVVLGLCWSGFMVSFCFGFRLGDTIEERGAFCAPACSWVCVQVAMMGG